MRSALPVFLIAAPLALLLSALPGLEAPSPSQLQDDEAEIGDCQSCHVEIYKEWEIGKHAKSWTDPIYQSQIRRRRRPKQCHSCHIPESIVATAPARPKVRTNDKNDGVHCRTCHVSEGKVYGPFGAKTQAHASVKSDLYATSRVDLCVSCHATQVGPVMPVARDFLEAGLDKKGKTCMGCHMPEVERVIANDPKTGKPTGPKRKGRRHTLLGPSDKNFLATAFDFEIKKSDDSVKLSLLNRAGHRIPGLRLRSFAVKFEILDKDGKSLWSKEETIDASRNNTLRLGESRDVETAIPKGAQTYTVEVHHLFGPRRSIKDLGVCFKASK